MADQLRVFTFKDGLLARLAHDLRLHVERFKVEREGSRVRVEVDPGSLVVDGVMVGERCDASVLGPSDRAKIADTIRTTILATSAHRTIEFHGEAVEREHGGLRVQGELLLAGVKRPLSFTANRSGARLRATIVLRPSEYGISPYKALAGAIRLQDRVVIECDIEG